jgi:hypothetical protein
MKVQEHVNMLLKSLSGYRAATLALPIKDSLPLRRRI